MNVNYTLEQIQNPDFWRKMNPQLNVNEDVHFPSSTGINIQPEQLNQLLQDLKQEGYFQIDDILPVPEIQRMYAGIEKLQQEGFPTAWAYIYDEFWQIFSRLSPILSAVLGKDYLQIADIWAWYVDTSKSHTGWEPHRDRRENSLLPDGMPKALNIWIPLTDVTPLNGCMYILPADLDPNYHLDTDTVGINPQDIRALPVSVGSILSWNPVVWHWGSRSSNKAKVPRVSLACDFQRADVEAYETPLLDPATPPNFEQRLGLISKLMLRFNRRYQFSDLLIQIAVQLQKKAAIPYWIIGNQYKVISDRWNHREIIQGTLVEIAYWNEDGNIMVRHPHKQGILYPFPPIELQDPMFTNG